MPRPSYPLALILTVIGTLVIVLALVAAGAGLIPARSRVLVLGLSVVIGLSLVVGGMSLPPSRPKKDTPDDLFF